eukprot:12921790-Prorocentrum_lima.AAC.1
MDWEDFSNGVGKKLAQSHLAGRHQAPVTPPTIDLVRTGDDDLCLSEKWKKWTDCCEDEEALVSAMSLGG